MIDMKIGMDKAISHSNSVFPGDFRKSLLVFFRNFSCGFAYNLKFSYNSREELSVFIQVHSFSSLRKRKDGLGRFEHVFEAD